MGGRHALVAIVLVGVFAGGAGAAVRDNPTAALNAASQQCAAQGLQPGSLAFNQCVSAATGLNVGTPGAANAAGPQTQTVPLTTPASGAGPGPKPAQTFTATQQAAIATCKGKGLVPNSSAYQDCIADQTSTGPALDTKQQAAVDACTAKGLAPRSTAYTACLSAQMSAPVVNLTPSQQTGYDACVAKGLVAGTPAFTKCFQPVAPVNSGPTPAQVMASTASCATAKNLTTASLNACIKKALG